MLSTQLKKGILDLCVLSLLEKEDLYGYQLVQQISDNIAISEGTIYPLLKRLRDEDLVTTYLQESPGGAPRKYYKLSETGTSRFKEMKQEWQLFVTKVNNLLSSSNEKD
jgi:PadR family transcriptional regulator PadR